MKLSEFKNHLKGLESVNFQLSNNEMVPTHFHVTEVGEITKYFIDCGGTIRNEKVVSFQLWQAEDYDHRLSTEKLLSIINLSESKLKIGDYEIEVEYQSSTIGKYGVDFDGSNFLLTNKFTDCLAKDNCGIPEEKPKVNLSEIQNEGSCCSPSSGCC
jgi:hypothetical protein